MIDFNIYTLLAVIFVVGTIGIVIMKKMYLKAKTDNTVKNDFVIPGFNIENLWISKTILIGLLFIISTIYTGCPDSAYHQREIEEIKLKDQNAELQVKYENANIYFKELQNYLNEVKKSDSKERNKIIENFKTEVKTIKEEIRIQGYNQAINEMKEYSKSK